MNIGDKVRLLHSQEEGIITKISDKGRIEIEIEDGFHIPAMKNEVVVISKAEKEHFGNKKPAEVKTSSPTPSQPHKSQEGIFLSYVPINDRDLSVHLINNKNQDFVFSASEVHGENSRTLSAGRLDAKTSKKLDEKIIGQFEKWPYLLLQFIPVNHKLEKTIPPFEKKIKLKASSFFKSKSKAPITGKDGYLIPVEEQSKELNVQELNKELGQEKENPSPSQQFKRPDKEIDLHIEKLRDDYKSLSNSEMLRVQMENFERNLNYAIASGMDEITFIHGIGNGVLKKEIHKYLSQLENIKYFQDTQKSRFGYGATLIRIN
ncbi:Smr/MutS family protein [Echinicola jeungdonensis]|uniref:Smr/MutS family protein n=1 Tax=Echinicola jeungdonensis TaxID=709343 RepID=A0ABV5J7K2_9BACT|nr:Smr/MutS family protein [Echinicola jeungdonensis]MDN3669735.1 Smr/MutS family protein [Echinicola jeungdonensis]